MSIEARVSVWARFSDDEKAKDAEVVLKKSLQENHHELASALSFLNSIKDLDRYKEDTINVEEVSRNKNILSIFSYTYSSENPTWFVQSLAQLGAEKIYICGMWDDFRRNYYFLNGKKVPKKLFDGDEPKKPLNQKDVELNTNLFLPEKRTVVKVQLISTWPVGDIYESTGMEFKMQNGVIFYYEGRGQLLDIFWNSEKGDFDTSLTVEFSAAFERGKLKNEYVSFAKRPTKISVCNN